MKTILASIMLVLQFSTISRAFIRSLPQKLHHSIAPRGYASSFRVLFTALGSSDEAQQAFDQLPKEVQRGFGGQTRKKKGKPTSLTASEDSNNDGETTTIEEIPAPPPPFSLQSHLTGNRVDLTWQYSFDAVATTSSSSSSELPFINPWGPVRKSAELKAIRVLLQPGEFTSSSQLSVDRLRQIAKECVPVPWLSALLQPKEVGDDCSDGSNDNTSQDTTTSSSSLNSSSLSGESDGDESISDLLISSRPRTAVSHADFLATLHADGGDHMLLEQALSLRKQLLVDKIINDGWKLRKHGERIHKAYHRGDTLLELARQYDLPPVAIFRDILTSRVRGHRMFDNLRDRDKRNVVKSGLRGEGQAWELLMTARDKQQLAIAKSVDHTSYADEDSTERLRSSHWEDSLYAYLDHVGIRYMNETMLKDLGSKSTPDCVLLDDCYVNGKLVRWIDMKNFYGSSQSRHFVEKLTKQAMRYDTEFNGPGAIVYKLGHSEGLAAQLPHTMILDRGPLRVKRDNDELEGEDEAEAAKRGGMSEDGDGHLPFETIDGVLFM